MKHVKTSVASFIVGMLSKVNAINTVLIPSQELYGVEKPYSELPSSIVALFIGHIIIFVFGLIAFGKGIIKKTFNKIDYIIMLCLFVVHFFLCAKIRENSEPHFPSLFLVVLYALIKGIVSSAKISKGKKRILIGLIIIPVIILQGLIIMQIVHVKDTNSLPSGLLDY